MINFTEFGVIRTAISHGWGRASEWRAKGLDAGPQLKALY